MIFDMEEEAFRAFARSFPKSSVFLLDTYLTTPLRQQKKPSGLPRKESPL